MALKKFVLQLNPIVSDDVEKVKRINIFVNRIINVYNQNPNEIDNMIIDVRNSPMKAIKYIPTIKKLLS